MLRFKNPVRSKPGQTLNGQRSKGAGLEVKLFALLKAVKAPAEFAPVKEILSSQKICRHIQ